MKAILFLCMVVAAAAHNAELSQQQKNVIRTYIAECARETRVKAEVLEEAKKGHFSNEEALKRFTLCFFKKTGIFTSDAKLNIEAALSKLPAGVDKNAVAKVLEECKKKTGKTHADTAFETFKCYHKATPTHVLF